MKKFRKFILLALIFAAILLAGCARSDVTLIANEDGSFDATVNYRIVKALVAGEAMTDAKAAITDSLDQNSIPYTETEDEEYVTITVERSFADLNELTSQEAWQYIGFAPAFVSDENGRGIWARYEDGHLVFSGTLDAAAFGAEALMDNELGSYDGSLRIVLPSGAESFSGGEADGDGYIWSGSIKDSIPMEIISQQIFSDLPLAQAASAAEEAVDRKAAPAAKYVIILIIVVIAAALAALALYLVKKKNPKEHNKD